MSDDAEFEFIVGCVSISLVLCYFFLLFLTLILVFCLHKFRRAKEETTDSTRTENIWENKRKLRINNIGPTNRQHITAKVFNGLQEFAKYIDLSLIDQNANKEFESYNDNIIMPECKDPFHEECYNSLLILNSCCPLCNSYLSPKLEDTQAILSCSKEVNLISKD